MDFTYKKSCCINIFIYNRRKKSFKKHLSLLEKKKKKILDLLVNNNACHFHVVAHKNIISNVSKTKELWFEYNFKDILNNFFFFLLSWVTVPTFCPIYQFSSNFYVCEILRHILFSYQRKMFTHINELNFCHLVKQIASICSTFSKMLCFPS